MSIELLGIEELEKRIKKLNRQANAVENRALREGAKVIHDEIVDRAPRSNEPRQPVGIRGKKSQSWRTGKHAADIIKIGNVRRDRNGKLISVGLQKGDTSRAFYLKFHEWGTSKMRARPFMEPAAESKEEEAVKAIRDALKRGLSL